MTVSTPVQPDSTTDQGNSYKAAIDAMFAGGVAIAQAFAPHEQSTPDMTVRLDAGVIHNVDTDARTSVAAQSSATITAPSTNPRNDIVYIDETTGAVGVAAGTEAASPTDPAIPTGKLPIAKIALTASTTTITNSILTDYRAALLTGWLKPDGDGSGLTGITAGASETDMRLAFLMIAENAGDRLNMVDGIADPYMDETDVDTATSSNETYDATGDYYHNPGAGASYTQENLGGASSTSLGTSAYQGQSFQVSTTDNITKAKIYRGTTSAATFDLRLETDSGGSPSGTLVAAGAEKTGISGAATGFVEVTFDTPFTPTASTTYWLIARNASSSISAFWNYDTSNVYASGTRDDNGTQSGDYRFGIYQVGDPPDMTLVSNAFTADSAPATGRIHIQVNPIDAITINTDLTAEISRDGGTTWTSATLVLKETLADGTKAYEADSVTISGQPSGTAMKYRIKTLNTKEVQIHGTVEQWT